MAKKVEEVKGAVVDAAVEEVKAVVTPGKENSEEKSEPVKSTRGRKSTKSADAKAAKTTKKEKTTKAAKATRTTKKTAEKTAVKEKATRAPRKIKEVSVNIQFAGKDINVDDFQTRLKEIYVEQGKKVSSIKSAGFYVNVEESKVYYTVNGEGGEGQCFDI